MIDKSAMLDSLKHALVLLNGAEKILNLAHGEGYAKEHPELVAAIVQAAAIDMNTRAIAAKLDELNAALAKCDATDALVSIGSQIVDAIALNGVGHLGGMQ